ncbi:class I SAM-dependent methyltransferase [Rhizobium sp. 21-4511-3d]
MPVTPEDAEAFIIRNLEIRRAPSVPEIRLYAAHSASRLGRLPGGGGEPPYWAYHWAGGSALARHLLSHPECVRGRDVIDLGCGSGIVAIAAAMGGARVTAIDTDAYAIAATRLNAAANGVTLAVLQSDLLDGPPPAADVILAGDLFYNRALAKRSLAFLRRCRDAGIEVLIGDPGRKPLPRAKLKLLASYAVADFGEGETESGVYTLA